MENFETLTNEQITVLVNGTEDKEQLRFIANELEITFSGNTGVDKLKEKILEAVANRVEPGTDTTPAPTEAEQAMAEMLNDAAKEREEDEEEIQVVTPRDKTTLSKGDLIKMDAAKEPDVKLRRQILKAQATRLIRCRVTNLDPDDSMVPGMLLTAYSKYTGKVTKYIPFGEENESGYHIPKILVDMLKDKTYNLRKKVKRKNGPGHEIKTTRARKFAIEELEPLTAKELADLAASQQARGAIDRTTD